MDFCSFKSPHQSTLVSSRNCLRGLHFPYITLHYELWFQPNTLETVGSLLRTTNWRSSKFARIAKADIRTQTSKFSSVASAISMEKITPQLISTFYVSIVLVTFYLITWWSALHVHNSSFFLIIICFICNHEVEILYKV